MVQPSPYTSGCSRKQPCIALNNSTQFTPFGSASENTKQENAARNSCPHGPCAIPPRHGQSQLISPVSGLKAPPPLSPPSLSPPSSFSSYSFNFGLDSATLSSTSSSFVSTKPFASEERPDGGSDGCVSTGSSTFDGDRADRDSVIHLTYFQA